MMKDNSTRSLGSRSNSNDDSSTTTNQRSIKRTSYNNNNGDHKKKDRSSNNNNTNNRRITNPTLTGRQSLFILSIFLATLLSAMTLIFLTDLPDTPQVSKEFVTLPQNTLRQTMMQQQQQQQYALPPQLESIQELRKRLPPSVWTTAGSNANPQIVKKVQKLLSQKDKQEAVRLCGEFLYSSITRAALVQGYGSDRETFVSTGDIDDMWTRDSAVQIGIYYGRLEQDPFLRFVVEGAIRRQAFNILQDPYANAYKKHYEDATFLNKHDRVLGRGGYVATRNYELDSGAYFLTQLYDYYIMASGIYKVERVLEDPMIYEAVVLMVNTWIVEQNHETESPYRYWELARDGRGSKTVYTGMSWSGFRPSDDPQRFGYHIPSNIFAAAALERTLVLNERIWKSAVLKEKTTKLLQEIETGIQKHGTKMASEIEKNKQQQEAFFRGGNNNINATETTTSNKKKDKKERIYAYEVDGMGHALLGFDDANVPSLLSIPLLGWSKYDRKIYQNTRNRILSKVSNPYYFQGKAFQGIGSPHTPQGYVWPMGFAIQALTEEGSLEHVAKSYAFQLNQSLNSACDDAMHESVHAQMGCHGSYRGFTREWFEWANALFVVLVETALGIRCDQVGRERVTNYTLETLDHTVHHAAKLAAKDYIQQNYAEQDELDQRIYEDRKIHDFKRIPTKHRNNASTTGGYYQGLVALIDHDNDHRKNKPNKKYKRLVPQQIVAKEKKKAKNQQLRLQREQQRQQRLAQSNATTTTTTTTAPPPPRFTTKMAAAEGASDSKAAETTISDLKSWNQVVQHHQQHHQQQQQPSQNNGTSTQQKQKQQQNQVVGSTQEQKQQEQQQPLRIGTSTKENVTSQ